VSIFDFVVCISWDSFASVKHWLREARENAEESAIFALVGA